MYIICVFIFYWNTFSVISLTSVMKTDKKSETDTSQIKNKDKCKYDYYNRAAYH